MTLVSDAPCTTALRGLLSLLPGRDSAAERDTASLSLVVNLRYVARECLMQTLQSLAALERHSHSLQRYPLVKQAFWEQVLASDLMVGGGVTSPPQLQLRHEQFPRLVLDFSRSKLTAELLETLSEFFETQQKQTTTSSGVKVRPIDVRVVPVALRFVRCRLTVELIQRLKLLMERRRTAESKEAAVNYCVTSLDLSENAMKKEELMALAELLNACKRQRRGELGLEELVLENAVGRTPTTRNWAAFRAFVNAAFGISPSILGETKTSLKRLSLANNSLSYRHVACISSALRHEDTCIEELSLAHTLALYDSVDRKMCWQWLAIGLRRMTPRERQPGLRRIDLSSNPLFPLDSAAWIESLRDPYSTAIQWLDDPSVQVHANANQGSSAVHCFLSSTVELYTTPSEKSLRLQVIEKEVRAASVATEGKEWEVLTSIEAETAWLCVVIPGFGVAWAQSKFAMSWERNEDSNVPAGPVISELVVNDMTASRTTPEALEEFVAGFRGRLQSLELRHNALSAMDLDAILANCQRLHTLDIEGCSVLQLQLLVDALSGDLGQHLRTLNLNANLVGAHAVNVLAAALRGQVQERVPVLEELHVAHNEIGANGVRHLHAALEANKKLKLLELDLPKESTEALLLPDDDDVLLYRARCMRLDACFQNELLSVSPLPVDRRIAFLLVANASDVVLDRGICCIIFAFAADEERRCILWNCAHA